jgi:hypothetical protein
MIATDRQLPFGNTRFSCEGGFEYLDEKGKWVLMEFSKEANEWKMDLPKSP